MNTNNVLTLEIPSFYPKQIQFMKSKSRYTAYGGARGGGKSFAARWKAILLAFRYSGIQILLLRRTLPELRENHLIPLQKILHTNDKDKSRHLAEYKEVTKEFLFPNGSRIKLGYCDSENDVLQFQGQAYDVIMMEEATHFCVTPDTEVLTDSGWKYIQDVRKTDKVFSSSLDGIGEYKEVEYVLGFQHEGVIYKYETRNSIDFAITDRHKLLTQRGLIPIENITCNDKILINPLKRIEPEDVLWYTDNLVHINNCTNEVSKIKMDIWLKFLGWYFSEGCSFKSKNHSCKVSIRQMQPNDDLLDMLNNIGYKYSVTKDGQYNIYSTQLYNIVHNWGNLYTKRIPRYVFKLNTRQINIFLNSFCLGDGHIDKRNGMISYGLANEGLIDDLQELYTLCGKVTSKSVTTTKDGFVVYRLTVRKRTNVAYLNKKKLRKESYNGDVWCLVVKDNHNFMTRRHGKIMITGNTEFQFQTLTESNRPSGLMEEPFRPRMYFTCNPGGVGHMWVRRLFIDKEYKNSEKSEDYDFIPSLVYENEWLMENDPEYVRTLENLPEERRNAMLYGNWDIFSGQFFDEFDKNIHVIAPEKLPPRYRLYRTLDYGLDKLACYHIIVDARGEMRVIHEIYESDLIVSEAIKKIKETTKNLGLSESDVYLTLAPSDLWNTNSQTGRSTADIFYENGMVLTKVSRDREPGWLAVKELLHPYEVRDIRTGNPVKTSRLKIFSVCKNLIRCIPLLQYDDKKYNDCATEPHEITHGPDALRCFATYWIYKPDKEEAPRHVRMEWTEDMLEDYYNGDDKTKERMIELYGQF